jgi:hypothetical protein
MSASYFFGRKYFVGANFKLQRLLFLAGKIAKKNYFQLSLTKMKLNNLSKRRIKTIITIYASLKDISHYYQRCIFVSTLQQIKIEHKS